MWAVFAPNDLKWHISLKSVVRSCFVLTLKTLIFLYNIKYSLVSLE